MFVLRIQKGSMAYAWHAIATLAVGYLMISMGTLVLVALGADLPYVPLLHAPWTWVVRALGFI